MKTLVAFKNLTPEQRELLSEVEQADCTPYIRADFDSSTAIFHLIKDDMPARHAFADRIVKAGINPDSVKSTNELLTFSTESILRSLTTFAELQAWISERWVYPAGSVEAFEHFNSKACEELLELTEAIERGNRDEVLGELGDVMFCMLARALSLGIDVNRELSLHESVYTLYGEDMTFKMADLNTEAARTVPWATLSHKVINGLRDQDIVEGIDGYELDICLSTVRALESVQASASRVYQNMTIKHGIPCTDPWVQTKAGRIESTAFDMVRYVTYMAHQFGKSFEDVVKMLQYKQLKRLKAGSSITRLTIDNGKTVPDNFRG